MNSFCTDSNIPNAYIEIKDYLYTKLLPILKSKRHIIFLCIGSDRATGDSLGPLIGYKLQNINCPYFHIYGSLISIKYFLVLLYQIISHINL